MDIHSFRTEHYFKLLEKLDPREREQADIAFKKWAADPGHERRLNIDSHVISVKLSEGNRAVGVEIDCPRPNARAVVWFFIGKHSDYEHMIKSRRLSTQMAKISEKIETYRGKIRNGIGLVKRPKIGAHHR